MRNTVRGAKRSLDLPNMTNAKFNHCAARYPANNAGFAICSSLPPRGSYVWPSSRDFLEMVLSRTTVESESPNAVPICVSVLNSPPARLCSCGRATLATNKEPLAKILHHDHPKISSFQLRGALIIYDEEGAHKSAPKTETMAAGNPNAQ